jgi:16S rRNA (cytidine1402-2'-O)-methyltransferase
MSGTLYVVATPIGNLEDITLRALRILREVSLIAAEDTRRTNRLLQHYSISTPTTSLHEHNERRQTPGLVGRLTRGESIALVSDAGTPLISDPGHSLVAAARDAGVRVESIPGPSAVTAILAATGLAGAEFTFLGFPPARSKDRKDWFAIVRSEPRAVVFFEAPHRIQTTLSDLGRSIGQNRILAVGREMTKAHEELVIKPISELPSHFLEPRGEFVLLLPPAGPDDKAELPSAVAPDSTLLRAEIGELTKNKGLRRREAMKEVGRRYGLSANQLYDLLGKQ